jgi:DHA2 family multidrug resistance protein
MAQIPNGTGLFNLTRQLGGSIGIALSATTLARLEAIHKSELADHITRYSAATQERLTALVSGFVARGVDPSQAELQAIAALNGQVTRQAMMLSFEQLFLLFGWSFALGLPLLLFMRKGKGFTGGGAAH